MPDRLQLQHVFFSSFSNNHQHSESHERNVLKRRPNWPFHLPPLNHHSTPPPHLTTPPHQPTPPLHPNCLLSLMWPACLISSLPWGKAAPGFLCPGRKEGVSFRALTKKTKTNTCSNTARTGLLLLPLLTIDLWPFEASANASWSMTARSKSSTHGGHRGHPLWSAPHEFNKQTNTHNVWKPIVDI